MGEIAFARAEEAQLNEEQWKKGKQEIMKQMEEAANERVTNELQIQKMRLVQELKEEEEKKQRAATEEEHRVSIEKESTERTRLASLVEKRKGQQAQLEIVEQNLRQRAAGIGAEKEQYAKLSQEINVLKQQQQQQQPPPPNYEQTTTEARTTKTQEEECEEEKDDDDNNTTEPTH